MKDWIAFWNSDTPIYVNERHKLLHYRGLAQDFVHHVPDEDAIILDYGCGEALEHALLARSCRKLLLSDAAPNVRDKLTGQFSGNGKINILSPEDVAMLSPLSLDLIIVHSVAQYIAKPDFGMLLLSLVSKLKPSGRLVVGDILPEGLSALEDIKALLRFGWQGGFLMAAFLGLVRTALSDYRKLRESLGLTHYHEAEMLDIMEKAGLTARRLEHNPGHNPARMGFLGLKVAPLD